MNISKENWAVVFYSTDPQYPNGLARIKKDEEDGVTLALAPMPIGSNEAKERQVARARLISVAPELKRLVEEVVEIGKGHAPSVGYIEELIDKAEKILNKIR